MHACENSPMDVCVHRSSLMTHDAELGWRPVVEKTVRLEITFSQQFFFVMERRGEMESVCPHSKPLHIMSRRICSLLVCSSTSICLSAACSLLTQIPTPELLYYDAFGRVCGLFIASRGQLASTPAACNGQPLIVCYLDDFQDFPTRLTSTSGFEPR